MAAPATAGSLRARLQALLEDKEKQLHYAGTLGQRVLEQQMELEERISQLREIGADKEDEDELAADARERYRELAETMQGWDDENAQLSESLAKQVRLLSPRELQVSDLRSPNRTGPPRHPPSQTGCRSSQLTSPPSATSRATSRIARTKRVQGLRRRSRAGRRTRLTARTMSVGGACFLSKDCCSYLRRICI